MENLSVGLSQFNTKDNLEKGIVSDIFGYGDQFQVNKSGKDIKEKLLSIKIKEESDIADCINKLKVLQSNIGIMPIGDLDCYSLKKYKHRIKWLPNIYTYEQRYPKSQEDNVDYNSIISQPSEVSKFYISSDKKEFAQEFNKIARKVGEGLVSMVQLNSFVSNLDEKKTYKLSNEQLAILGF